MVALPLGLDIAVIRRYFEFADNPVRRRSFINSTWRFLVVYPLFVTVGLGLCAWPIVDANSDAIGGADTFILLLSAAMWVRHDGAFAVFVLRKTSGSTSS